MRAVMALESNLAFESQHILHAMTSAGMKMWVAMGEGRGGELGFLTTNERKEEMCLLLREAMKCFRISVHKEFVSISMGAEKGKNRLRDELSNYCVINEQPKSAFGKLRKTFTGKLSGHQDDTAVALQIALLSSKIFYQVQTLYHYCITIVSLFRCSQLRFRLQEDRYATYRLQDWTGDWNKRFRVT